MYWFIMAPYQATFWGLRRLLSLRCSFQEGSFIQVEIIPTLLLLLDAEKKSMREQLKDRERNLYPLPMERCGLMIENRNKKCVRL